MNLYKAEFDFSDSAYTFVKADTEQEATLIARETLKDIPGVQVKKVTLVAEVEPEEQAAVYKSDKSQLN